MQDFRNLQVWQKAHELTLAVYRMTQRFPRDEAYGLTSQMRRSAASVPANIAEGTCRGGDTDFGRFVQIAFGSASELDYFVLLSRDLGYLTEDEHTFFHDSIQELRRMLNALLQKLRGASYSRNERHGQQPTANS